MSWTLVTGGARGLGAEICRTLAKKGHPVIIHYRRSEQQAQEVASQCKNIGVQAAIIHGDFASLPQTQDFICRLNDSFPNVHNLINNVGNYQMIPALDTTTEMWYDLFQTNLHAPFLLIQALAKELRRIVNIGVAGVGRSRAVKEAIVYNVTKEALWALTRSLAYEIKTNATINMISPGELENSECTHRDHTTFPKKRQGKLTEVAEMVAYLLSDQADYITGQNIEIDGGMRL